jgi:hypothetical protein
VIHDPPDDPPGEDLLGSDRGPGHGEEDRPGDAEESNIPPEGT